MHNYRNKIDISCTCNLVVEFFFDIVNLVVNFFYFIIEIKMLKHHFGTPRDNEQT